MKPETLQHIVELAQQGATILFVGGVPEQVPGLYNREQRMQQLQAIAQTLPSNVLQAPGYKEGLAKLANVQVETMKSEQGLKCIRRSNETGYHYFISCLQEKDVDAEVELAVKAKSAIMFDALTGKYGIVPVQQKNGRSYVRLQLASGESCLLQTYTDLSSNDLRTNNKALTDWKYRELVNDAAIDLTQNLWKLDASQLEGAAEHALLHYKQQGVSAWTTIEALKNTKGTVAYTTTFKLDKKDMKSGKYSDYLLDLGDVRESAHVYVNGQDAGIAFSVPYRLNIGQYLKPGKNEIRIEVTGLCANYIAQMDRDGKQWRIFKDTNIAVLPGYHKDSKYNSYAWWGTVPCGLNSSVKIIPLQ